MAPAGDAVPLLTLCSLPESTSALQDVQNMVQQLLDASALSGMECQSGQRQILSLHNRNSQ